jgi:hypothetical protein
MSAGDQIAESRERTRIYPDWEPAARASRSRLAVSARPTRVEIPGGEVLEIRIVKPLFGDPYAIYASSASIRVRHYSVTAKDVDRITRWKAW